MNQQIRFCKSFDGTRIAYAVSGQGPLLVRAPHWLTHLEYEFQSPVWQPWIKAFSADFTFLRMDERACGLSDWDVPEISFEAWVRDLEAVVDAAEFERFALLGCSQGAPISIEYAVRHPERVAQLVLWGGYARGWMRRGLPPERMAELEAQLKLVEAGWGREDASYRQMFAMQFTPRCHHGADQFVERTAAAFRFARKRGTHRPRILQHRRAAARAAGFQPYAAAAWPQRPPRAV
jgi:pimeloyl-ACP methyl ester carboxylesterase